jgi:hypothetical protein
MPASKAVISRQFNVGPGLLQDFETGALLHAILGWPETSEGEEVIKTAFMALCAGVIATSLKEDPSRREKLTTDFPDYVTINKKEQQR